MSRLGVPYQGSKNFIARQIVDFLPRAETFVDLFAGGCAVTHAAILSGKFSNFIANDLQGDGVELFQKAIDGEFANETRWISREDFFSLKESDAYVSLCWSFGNNRCGYLYAKEIEPWKKALHYARVFGDFSLLREMGIEGDGSLADILKNKEAYKEKYIRYWLSLQVYTAVELDELINSTKDNIARDEEELRSYLLTALKESGLTQSEVQRRLGTQMSGHYFGRSQWRFPTEDYYRQMQTFMPLPIDYNEMVGLYRLRQSLQSLERLESLQRLERLERLQSLQSLTQLNRLGTSKLDYRAVDIPENSCVYCDPPYKGTTVQGYKMQDGEFSTEDLLDWAAAKNEPVLISEYNISDDRFECAKEMQKRETLSPQNGTKNKTCEKIYVQKRFACEFEPSGGQISIFGD